MQRKPWFELHDHRLFPRFFRDLVTDALEAIWNANDTYHPIVPRLRRAMEEAGTRQVIDLCSGGGGPWFRLQRDLAEEQYPVSVRLTDKYPNQRAFERANGDSFHTITAHPHPVDALHLPRELTGFRTIFSSFHHFHPEEARAILADTFERREGIGVFEAAECSGRTLSVIFLLLPPLVLVLTPNIQPFRWARLFWTYIFPVIPFVIWLDGLLSCLRSYSQADLLELTAGLDSEDYRWQVGQDRKGLVGITYLIGSKLVRSEVARHQDSHNDNWPATPV
jgi:hypothetical protein